MTPRTLPGRATQAPPPFVLVQRRVRRFPASWPLLAPREADLTPPALPVGGTPSLPLTRRTGWGGVPPLLRLGCRRTGASALVCGHLFLSLGSLTLGGQLPSAETHRERRAPASSQRRPGGRRVSLGEDPSAPGDTLGDHDCSHRTSCAGTTQAAAPRLPPCRDHRLTGVCSFKVLSSGCL